MCTKSCPAGQLPVQEDPAPCPSYTIQRSSCSRNEEDKASWELQKTCLCLLLYILGLLGPRTWYTQIWHSRGRGFFFPQFFCKVCHKGFSDLPFLETVQSPSCTKSLALHAGEERCTESHTCGFPWMPPSDHTGSDQSCSSPAAHSSPKWNFRTPHFLCASGASF